GHHVGGPQEDLAPLERSHHGPSWERGLGSVGRPGNVRRHAGGDPCVDLTVPRRDVISELAGTRGYICPADQQAALDEVAATRSFGHHRLHRHLDSALLASDMTISVLPVNAAAFKGVRRRAVRCRPDVMGEGESWARSEARPLAAARAFATDPSSPPGG